MKMSRDPKQGATRAMGGAIRIRHTTEKIPPKNEAV